MATESATLANRLRPVLLRVARELRREIHSLGVTGGQVSLLIQIKKNPGITASALAERVFDPFVSTKPEGVGLGLVNVKAVVEGHGGGIRLEPRQPRGTCADIWLPVSRHG